MRLSAPTQPIFFISIALAVVGILGKLGVVAQLAQYGFWAMTAGFVLIALGCLLKGM